MAKSADRSGLPGPEEQVGFRAVSATSQQDGHAWEKARQRRGERQKRVKMAYPYMDPHSALKRQEMWTHTTTWMTPENAMLSEVSQTRRTNTVCDPT